MTVDLSADGGLDALGNWHDTDGKFQVRGHSSAKSIAVRALRGVAAAARVKARPDGEDLDLSDGYVPKLVEKVGRRPRVTYHDDRYGAVTSLEGRQILVPWGAFEDAPDAPIHASDAAPQTNDLAEKPAEPSNPLPEAVAAVHEEWPKLTADTVRQQITAAGEHVRHRIRPDAIARMVDDGRQVSRLARPDTWDQGDGEQWDDHTRRVMEQRVLGIPLDLPDDLRPVYAFGQTSDRSGEQAGMFGSIEFGLRPEVLERSTVTLGDSFHSGTARAIPYRDLPDASDDEVLATVTLSRPYGEEGDAPANGYAEFGIMGGVSLADVESVTIDPSSYDDRAYDDDGEEALGPIADEAAEALVANVDAFKAAGVTRVTVARDRLDPADADRVEAKLRDAGWDVGAPQTNDLMLATQADHYVSGDYSGYQQWMADRNAERAERMAEMPTSDLVLVTAAAHHDLTANRGTPSGGIPESVNPSTGAHVVMSPRDAMIDLVAERHLAVAELRRRDEVPPQFEQYGWPRGLPPQSNDLLGRRDQADLPPIDEARVAELRDILEGGARGQLADRPTRTDDLIDPTGLLDLSRTERDLFMQQVVPRYIAGEHTGSTDLVADTIGAPPPETDVVASAAWDLGNQIIRDWWPDRADGFVPARRGRYQFGGWGNVEERPPGPPTGLLAPSLNLPPAPPPAPEPERGPTLSERLANRLLPANDLVEAPVRPPDAPVVDEPDAPAQSTLDGLPDAEKAAERAIDRLSDIHHEDMGINGVDLPTLPTVAEGHRYRRRDLAPETQRLALDGIFNPPVGPDDLYFSPVPIVDATPDNDWIPVQAVQVNTETGEIVGTRAPWIPGPDGVPPGPGWVSLPASHPKAADLVTAAWLASPQTKRYLAEQLYPRLRGGYPIPDLFPGLTESVTARSDEITERYRDRLGINVRRVTDLDGTHYVPDEGGKLTVDGRAIGYADFAPDGGVRLWAAPDAIHEPDARDTLASIDYTTVDDPDLPWHERVAALAEIRSQIQTVFGPNPGEMFTQPTEADMPDLVDGYGGAREFADLDALSRFGQSLEALVAARRTVVASQPDKRAILDKLAGIPGIPPPLATLLADQPWEAVVGRDLSASGGRLSITFPDHPESEVLIYTSPRTGMTTVAWEFAGDHQNAVGLDRFAGWSPHGALTVDGSTATGEWLAQVAGSSGGLTRTGDNTPEMTAWLDTMGALGIDMGLDDSLYFAEGRDLVGEQSWDAGRGAVPVKASDLDGALGRHVEVGLRPYPKAWTSTLGQYLTRVAIDDNRSAPAGTSLDGGDVYVIDVPSIDEHAGYADVVTHEFAHQFERGVDGLMLIETWHFIQRLRREAAKREELARWQYSDSVFGFSDEFGDEYMGRVYKNNRTGVVGVTAGVGHEIFSTAAQTLWANDPQRNGVDVDPESRRLLMGLMAVIDPAPPTERWTP